MKNVLFPGCLLIVAALAATPAAAQLRGSATAVPGSVSGAAYHKPKHLPVGTCDQSPATADAGRLRHSAAVSTARFAVAEPVG
jgi:hypothetical protein